MALFDRILGTSSSTSFSKPEAYAGIMLAVSAADGDLSDEEVDAFLAVVRRLGIFREQSVSEHDAMMKKLFNVLSRDGVAELVSRSASALPANLRESAFAVAADLIFVDGYLDDQERSVLEGIQTALEIPDDLARAIVEVMAIKNRQ